MENFKYYLNNGGLDEAKEDVIKEIAEALENAYASDQIDIINEYQSRYEVFDMDDLNDEFDNWSVRDILEELIHINPSDDFFEKTDYYSGDDPFELADITSQEIAEKIFENWDRDSFSEARELLDEYEELEYRFTAIEEKREAAKALIEMASVTELDEIVNLLWTRRESD